MQSGLSWWTILRSRPAYKAGFANFEAAALAQFSSADIDDILLSDTGIVRNQGKIKAAVANAKAALEVKEEFGSLAKYVWSFLPHERPIVNHWTSIS